LPLKLIGKIASGDHDSRLGVEADLTSLKLDNILPGWVKVPGKSGKATFNVVQKQQSTRFEDIVVDGGGVSIKDRWRSTRTAICSMRTSRSTRRRMAIAPRCAPSAVLTAW